MSSFLGPGIMPASAPAPAPRIPGVPRKRQPAARCTFSKRIELTFPEEERAIFDAQVLYPLAGLQPAEAPRFSKLSTALERDGTNPLRAYNAC
jgi:hypothetical protein